ncbi:hypothetical protein PG995_012236 [Apiospora arundinis]
MIVTNQPVPMAPNSTRRKRRSRRKDGPDLVFVNTAESFRTGHENKDLRLVIRHQAARSGCRNRGRTRDDTMTERDPQDGTVSARDQPPPVPRILPSYNGYETMRIRFDFDITCLTSFTDIDFAANACSLLQHNLRRSGFSLQSLPTCFLAYLPSRYGSRPFLDDAMHCVAARAAHMVGLTTSPTLHTALYSKALASLRAAVKAGDSWLIPEVYCATRLLVLYETIGPPNQNALIFHSNAGIDLIKQMDPTSEMSAFNQILIRSQGPYIIAKAMFEREPTLFETSEWKRFFDTAASTETDADSQLIWKFMGAVSFLPGVLRDVHALHLEEHTPARKPSSDYMARGTDILERTERMYWAFQEGHRCYQRRPPYPSSLFDLPEAAESPGRIRLRGYFFNSMLFFCRLRATFIQNKAERAASEAEAQAFAARSLLATGRAQSLDPVLAWHLEERNSVSRSVVRTKEQWDAVREQEIEETGGVELAGFLLRRLQAWLGLWSEETLAAESHFKGVVGRP